MFSFVLIMVHKKPTEAILACIKWLVSEFLRCFASSDYWRLPKVKAQSMKKHTFSSNTITFSIVCLHFEKPCMLYTSLVTILHVRM